MRLHNPSKSLAFFVRLKVNKGKGGDEVLPVLWEDNYVSLLPGEQREITARYRVADLGGSGRRWSFRGGTWRGEGAHGPLTLTLSRCAGEGKHAVGTRDATGSRGSEVEQRTRDCSPSPAQRERVGVREVS